LISYRSLPKERASFARRFASKVFRHLPFWVTGVLLAAAFGSMIGNGLGGLPAWAEILLDILSNFSAVFLGIFIEAAPFLLLGTLASGVVEEFISRDDITRLIPRQPLLGALAGSLVGLFFPVCECGVVPFSRRLIHKGAPVSVGVAVLLAAPVLNPIVIASTLAAFGPGWIFWARLGLTLLIATSVGFLFALHSQPEAMLRFPPETSARVSQPVVDMTALGPKPVLLDRVRRALVIAVDEFFEMGRFLITGALLAATMQTFVPQTALLGIGQGPLLSVLAMVLLAVLLSICSTVDAFIALAFTGTFTGGSILAFLVFGPMVDIKSTLMFLRVFKPRTVAYLILLPLMLVLVAAVFLNYFGQGWLY